MKVQVSSRSGAKDTEIVRLDSGQGRIIRGKLPTAPRIRKITLLKASATFGSALNSKRALAASAFPFSHLQQTYQHRDMKKMD